MQFQRWSSVWLSFRFSEVHFLAPEQRKYLLPMLALLGVLFVVGYWRRARGYASLHAGSSVTAQLLRMHSPAPLLLRELPILAGWLLFAATLVVVMMQPVAPSSLQQVKRKAVKVAVVFDVSKSTSAEDCHSTRASARAEAVPSGARPEGSRLQAGAAVFRKRMLASLGGAPVNIITYRGEGWRLTPTFTSDYVALKFIEDHFLREGMAPGQGSDISYGLLTAIDQLDRYREPGIEEVIVLFSDGGFTGQIEEDPVTKQKLTREERLDMAVGRIKKSGIKLIVVGVGLTEPAPIPLYRQDREGRWQRIGVLRDGEGENAPPILTSYHDAVLIDLARKAEGRYFHVHDPDQELDFGWQSILGASRMERRETHVFRRVLMAATSLLAVMYLARFLLRR